MPYRTVTMEYDDEFVIEAGREGRRPRYHRGAIMAGTGVRLDAPQCNIDDSTKVRYLDALPAVSTKAAPTRLVRPWQQLCRRCWAGSDVLVAAALDYANWMSKKTGAAAP